MKKAIDILGKVYVLFLVLLTMLITGLGCYQVAARYFLGWNIAWCEELMRNVYCAIVFYGIGLVAKRESFVTLTLFSDIVSKRSVIGSKLLKAIQYIVQIAYFGMMAYFGVQFLMISGRGLTPANQIPLYYIYTCLPVGGAMGAAVIIFKFIDEFFPGLFSSAKKTGAGEANEG